MYELSEMKILW